MENLLKLLDELIEDVFDHGYATGAECDSAREEAEKAYFSRVRFEQELIKALEEKNV